MKYSKLLKLKQNKEWKRIFDQQVKITADTLKISIVQAEKRYTAMLLSGIIDNGNPDDPKKQKEIEDFLQIEQP